MVMFGYMISQPLLYIDMLATIAFHDMGHVITYIGHQSITEPCQEVIFRLMQVTGHPSIIEYC